MYILYTEQGCPFCRKVLSFMAAKNIKAELRDRDTGTHGADLFKRGGSRQVPYLVDTDTGVEIYESDDIVAYMQNALSKRDTVMTEPVFHNSRFDPDITPFHGLAKEMAGAFGYTADLEIDPQLAQLLRLRVAQINNCAYCLILHSKAARDRSIHDAKIDGLGSWWESGLYSEAERAAFAYCDALTEGRSPGFEAHHDALAAHFGEKAIAEIAAIVINMNLWTRLKLAQGATPHIEG